MKLAPYFILTRMVKIHRNLEDMLRTCVINFKGNWNVHLTLIELAGNNSYQWITSMAQFEALYGRRFRYPIWWFEVGEFPLLGLEIYYQAIEKVWVIRDRFKMAQSRLRSYSYNSRMELEFEVSDWVYLMISPMKGAIRFGKKGKHCPQYVVPYEILKWFGKVDYELKMPNELAPVHQVFHVSMLKKSIVDMVSILPLESIGVNNKLSY